jgi:hypothetical protein
MWIELLVILAIISLIVWLFGGADVILGLWCIGGVWTFTCVLLYIGLAYCHKILGPFIFG